MIKLEAVIKQFERAGQRLEEVLKVPETDIVRDSAIQRFEFTLDLSSWILDLRSGRKAAPLHARRFFVRQLTDEPSKIGSASLPAELSRRIYDEKDSALSHSTDHYDA